MPGRRIFHQDGEFLSMGQTAGRLGCSPRTVRRYMGAGMLVPTTVDRGFLGQHWFAVEDVERLAQLRNQGLLAPRDGSHASGRPFSSFTTTARRALRLGAGDDEGWLSPAEERGDQLAAPPPRPAAVAPLCCPSCGGDVEIRFLGIGGARPDLNQVHWCDRCGAVDVAEPEPPDPNLCPHCGVEVIREWRRDEAGESIEILTCEGHGDLGTAPSQPAVVEAPFRHHSSFSPSTPTQLSRGEQARAWPGDVIGAVRKPPPPLGPPGPTWLPPFDVGH